MKDLTVILFFSLLFLFTFFLHQKYMNHEISGIHDWRQTQTAWNIRNFARYDFNILNPRVASFNGGKDNIYRYEFPIYQWMIGGLQKILGEDVRIIRYFTLFLGFITLLGFYFLLIYLGFNKNVAIFGVFALNFSPVFYYYTINPIPDNLALFGAIWFLAIFFRNLNQFSISNTILSAFFFSLSVAAKLPFILFGGTIVFYFISQMIRNKTIFNKKIIYQVLIYLALIIPTAFWYLWVMPTWENGVTSGIFANRITWRKALEILDYHTYIMFPKKLMNFALLFFLIIGFGKILNSKLLKSFRFNLLLIPFILFVLYFVFELNMIDIVHDYYMFPFIPFLYIIIAYGLNALLENQPTIFSITLLIILIIFIPCLTIYHNKNSWDPYSYKEVYEKQNDFINAVPKDELCIILNDESGYILPYLIDKRGHIFSNDHLPKEWVKDITNRYDIKYMYSTSRKVESEIAEYIQDTLYSYKNINVFKLNIENK